MKKLLFSVLLLALGQSAFAGQKIDNYLALYGNYHGAVVAYKPDMLWTFEYNEIDPTKSLPVQMICSPTTGKCIGLVLKSGRNLVISDEPISFDGLIQAGFPLNSDIALVRVSSNAFAEMKQVAKTDYYELGQDPAVDKGWLDCGLATAVCGGGLLTASIGGVFVGVIACLQAGSSCGEAVKKMKVYMAEHPEKYNKNPDGSLKGDAQGGGGTGNPGGQGDPGPGTSAPIEVPHGSIVSIPCGKTPKNPCPTVPIPKHEK